MTKTKRENEILKRALGMAVRYNMSQEEISPCNICPLLDEVGCIKSFGVKQTNKNCVKALSLWWKIKAKEATK